MTTDSVQPTRPTTEARASAPAAVLAPPWPAGLADLREGPYRVTFARSATDLERLQRLRFEVFNRELGEGLQASWTQGLDADPFDPVCHHLMLVDRATEQVLGTYRLQTLEMARAARGLYCDQEFDLAGLAEAVTGGVELGRACIAAEHRNGSALFALWRGLAAYLTWSGKRYLFGCCSLTSQDEGAAWSLHRWLASAGHVHPRWSAPVRAPHRCILPAAGERPLQVALPRLFGTYLRHGARVCSEPAIDREFRTIDWLVVLDARGLPARLWRLFFAGLAASPLEVGR